MHRLTLPPPHQEIPLVLISVRGLVDPRVIAAGRIMSMNNSSDTTENRTRDLPAQCLNQLRHRVPHFLKCYA